MANLIKQGSKKEAYEYAKRFNPNITKEGWDLENAVKLKRELNKNTTKEENIAFLKKHNIIAFRNWKDETIQKKVDEVKARL